MQIYAEKIFKTPIETIEVFEPKNVTSALDRIEVLKSKGLYLVGYMRYDLNTASNLPLIYFEAFDSFEPFVQKIPDKKIGTIIKPLISKEEYAAKVAFIKEQIKNGITYEVNYTYPSALKTNANETELYHYLLQNQKTPYNAFLQNKYETILSFSPELFFVKKGNKILTKPMKGTVKRGKTDEEDTALKNFLFNDLKNRTENIMIVDLLRNDLGRISKPGTVKADKLFDIEQHKTLFQMTSEISSELKEGVTLYDIIRAIYPCGSITGAPKISTMEIIDTTEHKPREVYCGAIGYIHGDEMIFSVPIRILQKKNGETEYRYDAGSAITWNSTAEDEWNETITKAKFLETDFSLIETGITDFEMHIERLRASSHTLGFTWNSNIEKLKFNPNVVNRIELFKDGHFEVTTRAIPAPKENPKVKIAHKVNSSNPFLYHKTSIRLPFPKDVFDEICVNEKGELTEGTFTNIGVQLNGTIYTPPIECGLLNGVTRQKLLREGKIKEKILYPSDLQNAEKIYCFNSVRGIVKVTLD
ncbi:MAG: bifunctional anthranilate synthase component I family protein/class IV aminotransferase [Fibrobacter sp.]|uniref:bifunctional anthranilate synthase component I family protein/class IV aminotransferase n=1 Tax=Fibrobacter sp. TaxID=35828 RepID=UPI0025B80D32|nr:bifunctional anthranilate synthase component I family protein/class IV aminotransferase [Fibrobacter sp.]MBQ7078436.1 bifunctional anthranilate synthase component I family protein/class IV aminotransferase [Fibrobacter sp.]